MCSMIFLCIYGVIAVFCVGIGRNKIPRVVKRRPPAGWRPGNVGVYPGHVLGQICSTFNAHDVKVIRRLLQVAAVADACACACRSWNGRRRNASRVPAHHLRTLHSVFRLHLRCRSFTEPVHLNETSRLSFCQHHPPSDVNIPRVDSDRTAAERPRRSPYATPVSSPIRTQRRHRGPSQL